MPTTSNQPRSATDYCLTVFFEPLLHNEYVALSVDAGTSKTFNKYKGLPQDSKAFDKIISNIEQLCRLSRSRNCRLNADSPSNGVNYRMLIYKDNISEIYEAAKIVRELGCKNFHIRPASVPFDGQISFSYTKDELDEFRHQIDLVNRIPERRFGFYYTLGKFDENFNKKKRFLPLLRHFYDRHPDAPQPRRTSGRILSQRLLRPPQRSACPPLNQCR